MAPLPEAPSDPVTKVTSRKALGELSPNVKTTTSFSSSAGGKPLSGSPLKRSFTASIEGNHGFTYLKKRKVSEEKIVGRRSGPKLQEQESPSILSGGASSRLKQEGVEQIDVPTVQQLSPTEPNTPTPSGSAEDGNDSSAERKSFSSLINYEPSSQHAVSSQPRSGLVFNGPSYAEVLRLRLRVAMFKVQTNQIDVPFGELQVENDSATAAAAAAAAENQPATRPTPAEVEEAVAALRREAQMKERSQRQEPVRQLLPAPLLRPTAYSSRTIGDWPQLSSSPPVPVSSSPPAVERSPDEPPGIPTPGMTMRRSTWANGQQGLGSSPVKGHVAEGLLGLRNSV